MPDDHAHPGGNPDRHDPPIQAEKRLIEEYVRGRDMPCPSCGYNLRDLHAAYSCPECGADLVLRLHAPRKDRQRKRDTSFDSGLTAFVFAFGLTAFLGVMALMSHFTNPAEPLALAVVVHISAAVVLVALTLSWLHWRARLRAMAPQRRTAMAVGCWLLAIVVVVVQGIVILMTSPAFP